MCCLCIACNFGARHRRAKLTFALGASELGACTLLPAATMRQVLAHAPMTSPTITRRPSLTSSPIRRSSKVLPLEDLHIHDRGFKAQNPVSPTFGSPANTEIPDTSEELLDEFSGGSMGSMGSMHGASYNNRDSIGATPPRLRVVDQGATGRVLRLRDGSGITCGRLPFFLSSPLGRRAAGRRARRGARSRVLCGARRVSGWRCYLSREWRGSNWS